MTHALSGYSTMALNGLVKQNAVYAGLTCGQTLLSPSPIPTISYSPAPSLPLPLPLPLDSPPSSSAAGCDGDGFLLPKLIGLSSRHWHAHTPSEVMMVALHICSAHQNKLAGMAWVYKEVTIKWIKCTVRAKSRTSLERAMRSSMKMALQRVRWWHDWDQRVVALTRRGCSAPRPDPESIRLWYRRVDLASRTRDRC